MAVLAAGNRQLHQECLHLAGLAETSIAGTLGTVLQYVDRVAYAGMPPASDHWRAIHRSHGNKL